MKSSRKRKKKGVLLYLLSVLAFFCLIRIFFFETYRVTQSSMNNTLFDGDKVLVYKRSKMECNKIYVFETDGGAYIKRCVGLPGDTIIISNNQVFINGKSIAFPSTVISNLEDPSHINKAAFDIQVLSFYDKNWTRENFGPLVIPADHYFFLGDNRPASDDSRIFGPIPDKKIIGRACWILYSTAGLKRSFKQIE